MATGQEKSTDSAYSGRQATVIIAPPGGQGELVLLSDLPRRVQEIQQLVVQLPVGMIPEEHSSAKGRLLDQLSVLFRECLIQSETLLFWEGEVKSARSVGEVEQAKKHRDDAKKVLSCSLNAITVFIQRADFASLGITEMDITGTFDVVQAGGGGFSKKSTSSEESKPLLGKGRQVLGKAEALKICDKLLKLQKQLISPRRLGFRQRIMGWVRRHTLMITTIAIAAVAVMAAMMVAGVVFAPVLIPLGLGVAAAGIGLVNAGVAEASAAAGAVMGAAPVAAEAVRSVATTAGVTAVNTAKILGQTALTKTSSAVTTAAQVAGETAGQVVTVIESHPVAAGLIATGASITGASVAGATAAAATISAGKAIHDFVVQKKGTDAERRGAERPVPTVSA
ncbi:MAG: hypothetical protein A2103_00055 [Gammaproteobacteria bacterium GWF2_41_13]|nr:MAG: hypothetical protein A2103_00055 [Gammaproteobacteria bacterium GWF2_41_13]